MKRNLLLLEVYSISWNICKEKNNKVRYCFFISIQYIVYMELYISRAERRINPIFMGNNNARMLTVITRAKDKTIDIHPRTEI